MTKSLAPPDFRYSQFVKLAPNRKKKEKKKQFLFSEILSMTYSELDVHA